MTFVLIAGLLGLAVGVWYLVKTKSKNNIQPTPLHEEELAPEATPTPALVAEIVKKNTTKKKPAKSTKPASKNVAKNKTLAKMEAKPKKKTTKK